LKEIVLHLLELGGAPGFEALLLLVLGERRFLDVLVVGAELDDHLVLVLGLLVLLVFLILLVLLAAAVTARQQKEPQRSGGCADGEPVHGAAPDGVGETGCFWRDCARGMKSGGPGCR